MVNNVALVHSPMSGTEIHFDPSSPGGLPLLKAESWTGRDTVSISAVGRELAAQVTAERDEAARQMDPTGRYQAALAFGEDFAGYMGSNINLVDEEGFTHNSADVDMAAYRPSRAFTTVSAQGTVVGISAVAAEAGRTGEGSPEIHLAQITRKDGFQLNIELDDDIRINDLEDGGLSIYYASSGITRTFDANGRETVAQGEINVLGTDGDDIIINKSSSRVDAGDGDDIIVNLADNTELRGGDGNDTILLASARTKSVTIDGGAGDDVIVAQEIENASIVMGDGNDSLTAAQIFGSTISSSGDDAIKTNGFAKSKLTSRNGALSTDIASILESTVAIDRVKGDFSIAEIRGSRLKFGDGNVFLNSNWIMDSEIELGKGDLTMNAVGLMKSSISNAGSSGKITLSVRHNEDSKITKGETSGFERGYSKYASGKKTLWTQTPEGAPHRVDLDGMLMNNALDQPTV